MNAERPSKSLGKTTPVGILISGRGTNMMALVRSGRFDVRLVASDRVDAPGLEWARQRNLATFALSPRGIGKEAQETAMDRALREAGVERIALAGYMRILSAAFVRRWHGRIVNIHPSLLPKYKGLDTHSRAIAAGDTVAGCSVHIVTDELDAGHVLGRSIIDIMPGDTPDTLAERVLREEHRLYTDVLSRWLASNG